MADVSAVSMVGGLRSTEGDSMMSRFRPRSPNLAPSAVHRSGQNVFALIWVNIYLTNHVKCLKMAEVGDERSHRTRPYRGFDFKSVA